jgi:O-antigen/teichoic acid export membrane protein
VLFSFPTWMLNTILISIDKQKVMLLIAVIGTVANIIMNFAVIPLWGYNGSALATAASEVIMFAAILAYLARHDLTIPVLRQAWRPLLGGGLLLAVGVMLRIKNIGTLAVVSVIFLTAYFIYIYMTGILKKDEKEIIRSVFTGLGDRIRRSRA